MLAYVMQGVGFGFAASVQPGPFQTYIISQALDKGWRQTWPAAFAPLIGDGPIIALVMLVLSQMPPWLERFLYIAGGLFVLYLAVQAYNGWRRFDADKKVAPASVRQQGVWKAALMNVLSPGPYIYWSLVAGPILVAGWRESPVNGLGFLVGFYGTMILSLASIIVLFATARRFGPKVNRALLGISAILLVCSGFFQLWTGLVG